jgi:hypothetical protein
MKRFEPNQVIIREDLEYPEGALVVHGYAEDGSLMAFPQGGGCQFLIPAEETSRFHPVSEDERNVRIFRKSEFCLEGLDDETFEGFTDGSSWNGWEIPYFELKTAQRLFDALGATWTLEADKNVLHAHFHPAMGTEWANDEPPLLTDAFLEMFGFGRRSRAINTT